MRLFVTGSTGFVGRALVRELRRRGHEVSGVDRRGLEGIPLSFQGLLDDPADWRNALAAFRPDAVVHLGWQGISRAERENADVQLRLNLPATERLVDLCAAQGLYFIGIGSQTEYGALNVPLRPDTPCAPVSPYGIAKKRAADHALRRLGAKAAWLRILAVYGPGDTSERLVPHIVSHFRRGEAPRLGTGDAVWDWMHVEDAARAVADAAEKRVSGIHVLASGETASVREVALTLRRHFLAAGLAAPAPIFGATAAPSPELHYVAGDSAAFRAASGWSPRVTLDAGLKELA